ncbi:MAG: MMPL family transporter, partial [Planctomycetes bacterium]|nr:MMPL family transporter [Planctomycetota bacterium]
WLPEGFTETAELAWFREHFVGEQFVLVSWPGCTAGSDSLALLKEKLAPPDADARHRDVLAAPGDADSLKPQKFVGDALGLYVATTQEAERTVIQDFQNWAGLDERWLRGTGHRWYFITPDGRLFRWQGEANLYTSVWFAIERVIRGRNTAEGDHLATLPERYYKDITLLEARLFKTVTTGPDVMERLAGDEGILLRGGDADEEARREARAVAPTRLRGLLFGPDGEQTCLIVTLTPTARENLHLAVGRGWFGKPRGRIRIYAEESGVSPHELRLGGPPVDNVAIDEEGTRTQVRLIGFAAAVGLLLALICFRSVKVTALVFFIGGAAGIISVGLVWWSGSAMDAVLMTMPALVYVLGMSGAVHMVNYYRDAVREHGVEGAPERALRHGWKPCALAAFTTALGLLSLCTSEIVPITKFGAFSAAGVMATLLLLFLVLPAWLEVWAPGFRRESPESVPLDSPAVRAIRRFWDGMADFVIRRHAATAAVFAVVAITFAVGLTKVDTSVQMLKLFRDDAEIVQDYAWLEENLGPLVPLEMVLRVDASRVPPLTGERNPDDPQANYQLGLLERVVMVRQVERAIEQTFGRGAGGQVGGVMTAATFAPELPEAGGGLQSFARRRAYQSALEQHRQEMIEADYLRIDRRDQAELWRVSLRLRAFGDLDYGEFVGELKQAVEPVMAAYRVREEVLRGLDALELDSAPRVLLVGPAFPEEDRPDEDAADSSGVDPLQQTRLFAETLYGLLRNARLVVEYYGVPAEGAPTETARLAADFDGVVLLDPDAPLDPQLFTDRGRLAIDARDHRFGEGEETPQVVTTRFNKGAPVIGVSAVYTGVVPVVYKAQRTLLNSLIESIGWAFVMIAVVMVVLLRSIRAGLVSMIPNVFPVMIIFGAMGWLGVSVDIGSMMTASVAMGVAVDDTIHFLTWFRKGLDQGLDRIGSIRLAYRRCAVAMTQTTAIGGLGLAVFAVSSFTPTQRFGVLMLTLLSAALVGDLIFLPALLAGPLGRVFGRTKKPAEDETPAAQVEGSPAPRPHARRTDGAHRPEAR